VNEKVVFAQTAIMSVRKDVKTIFVCCLLALTCACASRTPSPGVPSPQPQPPDAPRPPVPAEPVPAPPGIPLPPPEPSSECAVISGPGEPIATVALTESVNPANAPRPTNDSERLVFRQIYETLVRVDCKGRVIPGLASSWRRSIDGRTWIVTLRPESRFSDGTPVTAPGVVALWSRDGVGGDLLPHVNRLVESLIAVDEETLAILLRSSRVDGPFALAHTDLAIARPAANANWLLGTRPVEVSSDGASITISNLAGGSIRFGSPRDDPRDSLDESVDLLITRNRAALDYAATLPQFQSEPLEWQQVEVLLSAGPARPLSDEERTALAADAVRGEARGATGPFWWQQLPDCEIAPPRALEPGRRFSGRVVYESTDSAARDLAERLVGVAGDKRLYQRSFGLTGEAFALALRGGVDAGYVMSLDAHPLDPCRDLQIVMERAPWLDPAIIVPLVETRRRAIVRRGHAGIVSDWDGGLLIAGAREQR
jgi:hypothetical protein